MKYRLMIYHDEQIWGQRTEAERQQLNGIFACLPNQSDTWRESKLMKYMLLVHHDEESFGKRSEVERQDMLKESVQLANQLHAKGQYLGAAPLHPTAETTCVKVRNGKPLVTDGPSRDARTWRLFLSKRRISTRQSVAARIPGARIGTVESTRAEVEGLPASSVLWSRKLHHRRKVQN